MRRSIQVFFLLFLVLTLLVLVSGFVSAGYPAIYCKEDPTTPHYPGTNLPGLRCTVTRAPGSSTYNKLVVDVADPSNPSGLINGEPPVKNWTFKELIIPKDFELYFENSFGSVTPSFYENNPGSPGINGGGDDGDGVGGDGGTDISGDPDHRNGGAGGHGGNKQNDDDEGWKGGGAGGGGAGGKMFQQGGDGAHGGTGKQNGNYGQGGAGSESPFAGANIRLILGNLVIKQNAVLSVSGMNGSTDCKYRDGKSSNKGGGAGGGAGGSGAGRLVIYTTTANYESGAAITANGGVGGSGCTGGDDTSGKDKAGGGGGAGGGGNGGELFIYYQGTTLPQTTKPDIYEAKEGTRGVAGKGGHDDGHATPAKDGYPAQDGQVGIAKPPVLVKEYDPNGTGSSDFSLCTDGIDNDFDGYTDFEDADCFNSAKEENEWDNDGPIPGWISLPGIYSYDEYTEWDPFSLNASDGICGDDVEECINKYDCSDIVYNPSKNVYASKCVSAGCNVDYLDGWCTGPGECSIFFSKSVCKTSGFNCLWHVNTTGNFTCSGNLKNICASFNTDLSSCDAHPACKSKQGLGLTDQSYVATTNSGLKRYYCSEDNKYNSANDINFVEIPPSESNTWKWWDAYQQGTSFTIHNYDGIDYIANGQEWFYCNANKSNIHENGSNAIPVAEGENFSSAVIDGGYTCIEGLTAAAKYFNDEEYTENDGWKGYFNNCEDKDDTFCCNLTNDDGAVPGYSLTEDGFKLSLNEGGDCGFYCYYNDSKNDGKARTPISSITNKADLLGEYCAVYDFDPSCNNGKKASLFGGTDGYFEKRSCGFDLTGCLGKTVALDKNCTDISLERTEGDTTKIFNGTKCKATQYCGGTQEYLLSYDTVPGNNGYDETKPICCLGEEDASTNICMDFEPPLTESSCQEAGGDYLNETSMGNYQCEGGVIYEQYCCLGGEWIPQWSKLVLKDLAQPDSFICYDHQQDNRFAECCTDFTKCFNSEKNSFFSNDNDLNHGYYGKGGVLHTLKNFDSYQEDATTGSKLLIDFIRVEQLNNKNQHMSINLKPSQSVYKMNNWTGFEYLEFDIAYNLERVNYVELEDGQENITRFNLTDYLTNGKKVMRWHHAVIPLTNLTDNFNLSDVEKIHFKSNYSGDNLYVGVDAFFLSENSSQRNFTDNYYCTGNFGSWIENLDGPTDEGFDKSNSNIDNFGKYWYACEAQASFDWTGHLCCGDDTRNGHYSTSNVAEYFSDSSAGCFHGNTVPSDTTVAYVLNDAAYNNLIFYKGNFFACMNDKYQKKVSYNSSGPAEGALDLVNKTMDEFSVIGDYICNDYSWVRLSSVSRSRIIASKMYNLSFTHDGNQLQNFSIYCDNITKVSPSAASGAIDSVISSIQDFCTLQYLDTTTDNPSRVLIGLSLDSDTDIETFLGKFYGYLRLVNAIEENTVYEDKLTNACKDAQEQAGFNNETNFFQKCNSVDGIHLRYNPDFKILFVGYKLENPIKDFNGLFKQDAKVIDYLRSFWDAFISLFGDWFGGGNQAGKQINWTNQTILPLFSGDGLVTAQNIVQLNKVYVSARGTKEIRGFTEQRYATADTKSTADNYTVMEYIGFNNSVQFLAKRYYGTANYYQDPYELNYFVGNDTQFILLVNANKSADVPFEPDFDWRRLGPMLQFNTTPAQHHFQAEAGNGVVDYGEWCDGNAFKFNNNTCAFWNETHIYCHVYCSGTHLDQSYCLNDSEASCGSPLPNQE